MVGKTIIYELLIIIYKIHIVYAQNFVAIDPLV